MLFSSVAFLLAFLPLALAFYWLAALERVARARPGTRVVDMRQDTAATREPLNFWDMTHYAQPLARIVEGRIGEALRGME